MLPRILIVVLCCTLVSCKDLVEKYKRSSSGVSALDKAILYDFRNFHPELPVVTVEVARKVFGAIPPSSCPVAANEPRQTLEIVGVATGSFTYAAEQETAYLVSGTPCGTHRMVVVLSGDKVQATSDTPYSALAATFDLNHDDKNEFLLAGETTHDAVITREASLENFEKNSLRAVENFGIVYTDPCALFSGVTEAKKSDLIAKGLSPYIEAVRISYLPRPNHEMPSFTAERLRAPCPATAGGQPGTWQIVSGK